MSTLPEHAHRSPTGGPPHQTDRGGTCATAGGHTVTLAEALTEQDRLRRENAALTGLLQELTHEFVPPSPGWQGRASCFGRGTPGNDRCAQLADHPVHRTPAVVRAELEERP